MNAEELMIGDWVLMVADDARFPEELVGQAIPHKVIGLNLHKTDSVAVINNFDFRYVNPNKLSPIPLTPEILKKNGFETEDDVHFSIQGKSNMLELLLVELPFDGYTFDIVRTERTINRCNQRCYIDRYFASIDYVHQLQHALRLCGINKEIVL